MCKQTIPNENCANTYLNQTAIDKSEIENFKSRGKKTLCRETKIRMTEDFSSTTHVNQKRERGKEGKGETVSFSRYVFCKHFLLVSGLPFHLLNNVF